MWSSNDGSWSWSWCWRRERDWQERQQKALNGVHHLGSSDGGQYLWGGARSAGPYAVSVFAPQPSKRPDGVVQRVTKKKGEKDGQKGQRRTMEADKLRLY